MDIQTTKLDLIQWLIQLNDERILRQVEAIQSQAPDFWDELSESQKQEIKKGFDELDAGLEHDYSDVMDKFR